MTGRIKTSLQRRIRCKKNVIVVKYVPRDGILGTDTHFLIKRRTIFGITVPFSGKTLLQLESGPTGLCCTVFDESARQVAKNIGLKIL